MISLLLLWIISSVAIDSMFDGSMFDWCCLWTQHASDFKDKDWCECCVRSIKPDRAVNWQCNSSRTVSCRYLWLVFWFFPCKTSQCTRGGHSLHSQCTPCARHNLKINPQTRSSQPRTELSLLLRATLRMSHVSQKQASVWLLAAALRVAQQSY